MKTGNKWKIIILLLSLMCIVIRVEYTVSTTGYARTLKQLLNIKFENPASQITNLYFDGCTTNGIYKYENEDSIKWHYYQGEYYLFLPEGLKRESLSVYVEADGYIKTDQGQKISSGYNLLECFREQDEVTLVTSEKNYTVHLLQSENLKTLFLATGSGALDYINEEKENVEEGKLLALGKEQLKYYDGSIAEIKGRGNSTWACEKKSYAVKLEKETALIDGAKSHENWVLLANSVGVEYEESLLRNAVAYSLAREMDDTNNKIQYDYVNLYINQEYYGVYQLCEKIQVGDNGIDIINLEKQSKQLNEKSLQEYEILDSGTPDMEGHRRWTDIPNDPDNITGGYLLEMDGRYLEETNGFVTDRGVEFSIKSPNHCSYAQMQYISGWVQDVEDAIYAEDGYNEKGYSYLDYLDMESFAEYYTLVEVLINPDAFRYSTFLYKDVDTAEGFGRLHVGPVWDFDRSIGSVEETEDYATIFLDKRKWIRGLLEKDLFQKELVEVYEKELRPMVRAMLGNTTENVYQYSFKSILDLANVMRADAKMNQIRWAEYLPTNIDEEAQYLTTWLYNRIEWLDGLLVN